MLPPGKRVPATAEFGFCVVPVLLVEPVDASAGLPEGIGETGDFLVRGRRGQGYRPGVRIAAHAAIGGSCAGMGHVKSKH